MQLESEAKLNKIKKVSAVLRLICKGLLTLTALVGLGATGCVVFGIGGIDFDGVIFATRSLSLGHRFVLGVVTAAAWAMLLKVFFHLHQLFGSYLRGEIFARYAVSQMRQFGIGCLLWGAVSWVWLVSLAMSSHPTKTFPGNADAVVIGVVIIVIAWFMDMAVDLREENDLTI